MWRIPSTAAWSAASLSPAPTSGAHESAADSVTRTSSSARLRSGACRVIVGFHRARRRSWPRTIRRRPTSRIPAGACPRPAQSPADRRRPKLTLMLEQAPNPLAEGLERQPVDPTALVIFGATGDLARRKLLPAIYNLAHDGALPERFALVGVSRRDLTDEQFRGECAEAIRTFSRRPPDPDVLAATACRRAVRPRRIRRSAAVRDARGAARRARREAGEPLSRAFYLSTAPSFFPAILQRLGEAGLNRRKGAEVRVVIEKPFGTTLKRRAS